MEKKRKQLLLRRNLIIIAVVLFVISLVPIAMVAGYDRATGDDLGYGANVHQIWIQSHSLLAIFKAIGWEIQNYYKYWQGTWFSIFLFCLQPEVFSTTAYWIVPILVVSILIGAVSFFLYQLTVRWMGLDTWSYTLVDLASLFLLIQFVPYKTSGIFWYNGAMHYVIPLSMALMIGGLAISFFLEERKKQQRIQYGLASILMILLSGTNYLSAILAPLLLLLFLALMLWENTQNWKKARWLLLLIVLEVPGLLISVLAPGNIARGGAEYEISIQRMLLTVILALKEGTCQLPTLLKENALSVAVLWFLIPFLWSGLGSKGEAMQKRFRYPGLVLVYLYGVYCAMYWPGLFAGVEVSGGVPNTIFQVGLLCSVIGEIYVLGSLKHYLWTASKNKNANSGKIAWIVEVKKKFFTKRQYLYGIWIVVFLGGCLLGRRTIKNTTDYICLEYVQSGQARDYKAQMDTITQILLSEERDVVLPPVNDKQGPLMHMPATSDPENFSNEVYARFYDKDSVVVP